MRRAWTYWRRVAAEARAEVGLAMSTQTRLALMAVLTVPWVGAYLAVQFAGAIAEEAARGAILANVAVLIVGAGIFLVVFVGTPPRLDEALRRERDGFRNAQEVTASGQENLRIELNPGGPFTLSGPHDPEVAKEFIRTFGDTRPTGPAQPTNYGTATDSGASPEAPRSPHKSRRGPKSPPPSQAS